MEVFPINSLFSLPVTQIPSLSLALSFPFFLSLSLNIQMKGRKCFYLKKIRSPLIVLILINSVSICALVKDIKEAVLLKTHLGYPLGENLFSIIKRSY